MSRHLVLLACVLLSDPVYWFLSFVFISVPVLFLVCVLSFSLHLMSGSALLSLHLPLSWYCRVLFYFLSLYLIYGPHCSVCICLWAGSEFHNWHFTFWACIFHLLFSTCLVSPVNNFWACAYFLGMYLISELVFSILGSFLLTFCLALLDWHIAFPVCLLTSGWRSNLPCLHLVFERTSELLNCVFLLGLSFNIPILYFMSWIKTRVLPVCFLSLQFIIWAGLIYTLSLVLVSFLSQCIFLWGLQVISESVLSYNITILWAACCLEFFAFYTWGSSLVIPGWPTCRPCPHWGCRKWQ